MAVSRLSTPKRILAGSGGAAGDPAATTPEGTSDASSTGPFLPLAPHCSGTAISRGNVPSQQATPTGAGGKGFGSCSAHARGLRASGRGVGGDRVRPLPP